MVSSGAATPRHRAVAPLDLAVCRHAPRPPTYLADSPRMRQQVDLRSIATDSGSATRRVITEHHASKYKHSSASLRVPQSRERTRGRFQQQVDSAARRTSHRQSQYSQHRCSRSQQRCHQRADPGSQRKESAFPVSHTSVRDPCGDVCAYRISAKTIAHHL